nr:hypothetical protein [Brucella intermedia]
MADIRICSVPGCGKRHSAKGYCGQHYQKFIRYGDPELGRSNKPYGSYREFIEYALHEYDSDDCLIWPYQKTNKGYAVITIDGTRTTVSRYICREINGKPPQEEYQAAHSCGNGHLGCINSRHLRWATPSENHEDKNIHGTMIAGEDSNLSKLSESDVLAIRDLRPSMKVKDLAEKFGCSTGLVWLICKRKVWRHI